MDDHNVIAAPDSGSFRHEVRPHLARAAEIFGDRGRSVATPSVGELVRLDPFDIRVLILFASADRSCSPTVTAALFQ
jgi:hypothetical protein